MTRDCNGIATLFGNVEWTHSMKPHALATLLPPMDEQSFNALVEDVRVNGLLAPIVTFENKILDGRNRFVACFVANVEPRFEPYAGDDPLGFVISLNLKRRHLNESQRAHVAARLETTKHGGTRQDANLHLEISRADAARLLNVSERSIASPHFSNNLVPLHSDYDSLAVSG